MALSQHSADVTKFGR